MNTAEPQWQALMAKCTVAHERIGRLLAAGAASPEDWQLRHELLQLLSQGTRMLSDAHTECKKLARDHVPPLCNLRIREQPMVRGLLGSLSDMPSDPNLGSGWLVLAADGTRVLEIWVNPDEWCSEAAARFERARMGTPAEVLARGLPAAEGVES